MSRIIAVGGDPRSDVSRSLSDLGIDHGLRAESVPVVQRRVSRTVGVVSERPCLGTGTDSEVNERVLMKMDGRRVAGREARRSVASQHDPGRFGCEPAHAQPVEPGPDSRSGPAVHQHRDIAQAQDQARTNERRVGHPLGRIAISRRHVPHVKERVDRGRSLRHRQRIESLGEALAERRQQSHRLHGKRVEQRPGLRPRSRRHRNVIAPGQAEWRPWLADKADALVVLCGQQPCKEPGQRRGPEDGEVERRLSHAPGTRKYCPWLRQCAPHTCACRRAFLGRMAL